MRFTYIGAVVAAAVFTMLTGLAMAGETALGSGCSVTSTSPTAGSTASDSTDCKWNGGTPLKIQCDGAVYYTKNGNTPTSASPKVAVGDPYPIGKSEGASADRPVRVLAVTGTVTCNVYRDDRDNP